MPGPVRGPRRGPRLHSLTATTGGAPQPLPLVATVGASTITPTSAVLVGSVNPQGLAGVFWFAYGTTPALGTTTSTQAVAATSSPTTVTATITGLSTGTEYWFAVVCETLGGTVTASSMTFTPVLQPVVTNASNPLLPSGTPAVGTPRVAWPFTMTPTGPLVVEQGSYEDTLTQVQFVAACPVGSCPELPTFGVPDLTFSQAPPSAVALLAAIRQWVPGADETAVVQALDSTGGSWGVSLTTTVTGTGQ